jgi:hypothetical protein
MSIDCPYGEIKKQGQRTWIHCNKSGMSCMFQRYCVHKKCVVFSTQASQCKLRTNG